MASWLILLVGVIYLFVAGSLLIEGKMGMSLAFFAYALSNVGLYIAAKGM